jgi:ATP-dependent protease ClpP protease subunit
MKIDIKGPIISDSEQWIYNWFGIPATSPGKVKQQIEQAVRNRDNEIIFEINSGGGQVYSASEIYTAIRSFNGKTIGQITGLAASAASVIAMGCSVLEMSPTSQIMIHNAATWADGDHQIMDDTSDFLQKVDQSIINAYTAKTGKTVEELKSMMNKTTWMTAQEALDQGFIDSIMFESAAKAVANTEISGMIPQKVIDKLRQELLMDKGMLASNIVPEAFNSEQSPQNQMDENPVVQIDNQNQKEENKPMNLEQLKNDHPELFQQVKNEGYEEGIKAENSRIKAIDELGIAGSDELVNQAKYETMDTAEKLAVNILKAQKQQGANFLQNRQKDAEPLNNVQGSEGPENKASNKVDGVDEEEAKAMAELFNKKRGGNQ